MHKDTKHNEKRSKKNKGKPKTHKATQNKHGTQNPKTHKEPYTFLPLQRLDPSQLIELSKVPQFPLSF
jgi:hypothetical protein